MAAFRMTPAGIGPHPRAANGVPSMVTEAVFARLQIQCSRKPVSNRGCDASAVPGWHESAVIIG